MISEFRNFVTFTLVDLDHHSGPLRSVHAEQKLHKKISLAAESASVEDNLGPVSYTHLTLPTRRTV